MIFFEEEKMKIREDERTVNLECLKTALFGHILKKIGTFTFFGAWSFLLIHIQFTLGERPKSFVDRFLKKLNHNKKPSSMVHGVNRPSTSLN